MMLDCVQSVQSEIYFSAKYTAVMESFVAVLDRATNVMHYNLFQMIFIMCCHIPVRLTFIQLRDIYSARNVNLFLSNSMKQ